MKNQKYARAQRLFNLRWSDLPSFSLRRALELPGKLIRVRLPENCGEVGFSWHSPDGGSWLLITGDAPVAYRLEGETLPQVIRWLEQDQWDKTAQSRDCVNFVFGDECPAYE